VSTTSLDDFPTVSREQIAAVLDVRGEAVTRYARIADECLPRGLKKHLRNHEVKTVPEAGWPVLILRMWHATDTSTSADVYADRRE